MFRTKLMTLSALAAVITAPAFAEVTVEPRGRLHLDAGFYDQDQTEFGDGINVRRGRLGMEGTLGDDWSFVLEYDFGEGGEADATDVYLRTNFAEGKLTIGQQRVPFGLNALTSSNSITFIERATPSNVVNTDRKVGVRWDRTFDDLTSQSMLFGRALGDGGSAGEDESFGFAQRLVFHPQYEGTQLHFGVAVAYESLGDLSDLRLRDRPELRVDPDVRLIDTGTMNEIDSVLRSGLEIAVQQGSFSLESEYSRISADSSVNGDVTFDGAHVQASYVLTGEQRGYSNGVFKSVKPASESGAWEVAVRYSTMSLNDGSIFGGEQNNLTLGVNYYLNSQIRFMGNVVFIDAETPAMQEDPMAIGFRMQYSF